MISLSILLSVFLTLVQIQHLQILNIGYVDASFVATVPLQGHKTIIGSRIFSNKSTINNSNDSSSDDNEEENETSVAPKTKKLSPLAMAAADWLEEEEDEWGQYWNKYETSKQNKDTKKSGATSLDSTNAFGTIDVSDSIGNRTTEELLDDYYETMGIDKKSERYHQKEIESALQYAKSQKKGGTNTIPSNIKTIIQKLEQVRPYLQPNTQLGGQALMELATAYYYDSNLDDDENDSSISKSETIVQLILEKNLDRSTIRQAKQLLIQITNDTKSNTRPSKGIFGFNFDTFSW